jgi:pimeloyl-ACP methyl ester carboxylesterase
MGHSTRLQNRRITHWPRDVTHLARALGWDRFALLGNSGGAPYVAACGDAIPERITRAVVISGGWRMDSPEVRELPLVNRLFMTFAKRAPFLLPLMLAAMKMDPDADPARELAKLANRMPKPDWNALAEEGRYRALALLLNESLRQGSAGPVQDLRLYVRDFGFSLPGIKTPIALLHGDADRNSPIALARRMASEIPGAALTLFPGEAHLSTLCNHFEAAAALLR